MRSYRLPVRRLLSGCSLMVAVAVGSAAPAEAGLLSSTVGLVDSTLGIVTSGWDDGATTAPVSLSTVADAVGADELWKRGIDGTGIDVAVIDTGIAPVAGLDGAGKVVNGPDLSFESQAAEYRHFDTFGHGTHMASIVAGHDSAGFKGLAPGARIVNIKVGNYQGAVDVTQVIAAIDWVVQHRNDSGLNVRVLSLAYGTDGLQSYQLDPLTHAVESAWRNGIVVVASGGNDGTSRAALTNPAYDPRVLAVGASDLKGTVSALDDTVAAFSSRGNSSRRVDLVAPGVSVLGLRNPGSTIDDAHPDAVVNERFFRGSGTSQAAAVTAGSVALLLQARPSLSPDMVKALLRTTATPLVKGDLAGQGSGRLNIEAAALAAVPTTTSVTVAPSTGTGSLEAARGTSHVASDGIELTGERDIMGNPWNGSAWAPTSTAGTAWTAGTWNGAEWAGTCWCGESWTATTWEGKSWTGKSWTGKSWTADEWSGKSWTGKSWTGKSWTGKSWTGKSWTGKSWTSATSS
ncbi:MAG TPA: S8 family serine peptidase [Acidimicrobiales bacterium]|nr:S8 family serine peptidase [Acidimicrobiales bacterium]